MLLVVVISVICCVLADLDGILDVSAGVDDGTSIWRTHSLGTGIWRTLGAGTSIPLTLPRSATSTTREFSFVAVFRFTEAALRLTVVGACVRWCCVLCCALWAIVVNKSV